MLTSVPAVASAMANAAASKAEEGNLLANSRIVLYAGPVPGNAQSALVGANTVLATINLDATNPFQAAEIDTDMRVAECLATNIPDTPASANGTVTFYRQFNRNNEVIWQGIVTGPDDGGDLTLTSVNVIADVNVILQRYSIRVPY